MSEFFLTLGNAQSSAFLYENAWKGAEAYHYYMLAQRQIYSGKFHEALCVAYKLQDYEEYIPESDIYSLLTLTSCLDRAFGICSKALMKLKTLENVSMVSFFLFISTYEGCFFLGHQIPTIELSYRQ